MRLRLNGNRQHLFGHRHFQIHAGIQRLTQDAHVAVSNVATIFTQMHGNAIRASLLGNKRGLHRVGVSSTTCITQRCDMVNVDAQQ